MFKKIEKFANTILFAIYILESDFFTLSCMLYTTTFLYTHDHVGKVIIRAITVFSLSTVYG